MRELARIALNDENIALRIAAGKEILGRAYGKPHRQLDAFDEDRLGEKIRRAGRNTRAASGRPG